MAILDAADTEADILLFRIGALAIDGEDLDLEILGDLSKAIFGDLLHIGEALLDILGLDGAIKRLGGGFCCIGPDFCAYLGGGYGETGFLDLAALEPGEFRINGNIVTLGVESTANDAFYPFDTHFLNSCTGL